MDYKSILSTSITSITRNKMRSFLTTLGVIIGVAAVILLTSIGNGIKSFITDQFEGLGSNSIYVMPGEIINEEGRFDQPAVEAGARHSKLNLEHVRDLNRVGGPIRYAVPMSESQAEVRYSGVKRRVTVIASSSLYSTVLNTKTQTGRFFTDAEDSAGKKVVVIGDKVAEKLFSGKNPVEKNITINNVRFKVVGVAEKKGGGAGPAGDIDNAIYVPYSVAKDLLNMESLSTIVLQARTKEDIPKAIAMAEETVGKKLKKEDFSIIDQAELLSTFQTILSALTLGLAGIAAISLVVGGIGIMNIMLVAVTERTKEIGLRKALGATPSNILVQFLIEAAALSSLGGIIGILIGVLGALGLSNFFPAKPAIDTIVLAFGVSFATGIIFGVFPARKASKLSPIEALRYE